MTYVCGTKADSQNKAQQKKLLEDAGCMVAESNIEAVKLACELVSAQ